MDLSYNHCFLLQAQLCRLLPFKLQLFQCTSSVISRIYLPLLTYGCLRKWTPQSWPSNHLEIHFCIRLGLEKFLLLKMTSVTQWILLSIWCVQSLSCLLVAYLQIFLVSSSVSSPNKSFTNYQSFASFVTALVDWVIMRLFYFFADNQLRAQTRLLDNKISYHFVMSIIHHSKILWAVTLIFRIHSFQIRFWKIPIAEITWVPQ